MTSQIQIQREKEKIEWALGLRKKRPTEIWITFSFGDKDKPHGKYGYQARLVTEDSLQAQKYRAIPEEEELAMLREHYETLPAHCKQNPNHVWYTFEKYLEYHRCECGKH